MIARTEARGHTYTNAAYMYVAQDTPFLDERAYLCRVYIHVYRRPLPSPSDYHTWKSLISSLSEANVSKRHFQKNANPRIIASLSQPAIHRMTVQK